MEDRNKLRFEGRVSFSRPMGYGNDYISIQLECKNSNVEFVEARISLEDFAKALTGQGDLPMTFQTRGLELVGKIREQKPLVFEMPEGSDYMDRKELAKKLAQNHCDEGWKADTYFGSQSSFKTDYKKNITTAHTRQYRFIDPEPEFETEELLKGL